MDSAQREKEHYRRGPLEVAKSSVQMNLRSSAVVFPTLNNAICRPLSTRCSLEQVSCSWHFRPPPLGVFV